MKFKLSFESASEFFVFIMATSSMRFEIPFLFGKNDYRGFHFLMNVSEVQVGDIVYSVEEAVADHAHRLPEADCWIKNYMLNDVQIKADHMFMERPGEKTLIGHQSIQAEFCKELPNSFLLDVGWRTDWFTYLFRKNAPTP